VGEATTSARHTSREVGRARRSGPPAVSVRPQQYAQLMDRFPAGCPSRDNLVGRPMRPHWAYIWRQMDSELRRGKGCAPESLAHGRRLALPMEGPALPPQAGYGWRTRGGVSRRLWTKQVGASSTVAVGHPSDLTAVPAPIRYHLSQSTRSGQ